MLNMKPYAITLLCALIYSVRVNANELQNSAHYRNLLQLTKGSLDDCFEDVEHTIKIEIDDAGFEALLKGERNPPRNAKCLRFCIMRKNKLFDEENQLSLFEMLEFFKKLYGSRIKEDDLNDVVVYCKEMASAETDSCERAHKAAMCILEEFKERGYGQF